MKERQQGASFGGYQYGYGGFDGQGAQSSSYGGYEQTQESNEMRAAANYINSRHFAEAMHVLNSMPDAARNGRWYYYAAIASEGLGNIVDAKEFARRAVALEPGNFQYRQYQQHLEYGSDWYADTRSLLIKKSTICRCYTVVFQYVPFEYFLQSLLLWAEMHLKKRSQVLTSLFLFIYFPLYFSSQYLQRYTSFSSSVRIKI